MRNRGNRILLTNDDGIDAPGLASLAMVLGGYYEVYVLAPDQERSGVGHGFTLYAPLRCDEVIGRFPPDLVKKAWKSSGLPVDCVKLALLMMMKENPPDLVVSGINRGYNLGEDVLYSGTVAAAMEATLLRIPSLAFSLDPDAEDYRPAAAFAQRLARQVLRRGLPAGVCLNVNFPAPPKGGYTAAVPAKLGRRIYGTDITRRADPRGLEYFWLAGQQVTGVDEPGTDVAAVSRGTVSITPLKIDNTDDDTLQALSAWKF